MSKQLSQHFPNVTIKETKQMRKQTIIDCECNKDIFEQFYKMNKELYSDISSKLLRIKKKKTRIK